MSRDAGAIEGFPYAELTRGDAQVPPQETRLVQQQVLGAVRADWLVAQW